MWEYDAWGRLIWRNTGTTTVTGGGYYYYTSTSTTNCTTGTMNCTNISNWGNPSYHDTYMQTYVRDFRNRREALNYAMRMQEAKLQGHSEEAQKKAEDLLLDNLTEQQRETFKQNGWFIVQGGKTGRKYRIEKANALVANIAVVPNNAANYNEVDYWLCGHCDLNKIPLCDHLLAQKLMLEYAEDDFISTANRHAA